jgi:hypothetical protein
MTYGLIGAAALVGGLGIYACCKRKKGGSSKVSGRRHTSEPKFKASKDKRFDKHRRLALAALKQANSLQKKLAMAIAKNDKSLAKKVTKRLEALKTQMERLHLKGAAVAA